MIKIEVINECTNKKIPFPEAIRRLLEIGIERYYTDMVKMEKTYYSRDGQSYVERLAIEKLPALANDFDSEKVIEAIRAAQKGEIDYHTFMRNILAAGTASYTVYLDGRQVVYVGRKGETHTEKFHF